MNTATSHLHSYSNKLFVAEHAAKRLLHLLNSGPAAETTEVETGRSRAVGTDDRVGTPAYYNLESISGLEAARRRIIRILEAAGKRRAALHCRQEKVHIKRESSQIESPPFRDHPRSGMEEQFTAAEHAIDDALASYQLIPTLAWSIRDHWTVDWFRPHATADEKIEGRALTSLLILAELGLLDRIRRCPCGEWFFVRVQTRQKFHSIECQQRAFRSNPKWKAMRAKQMRQLRAQEKKRRQAREKKSAVNKHSKGGRS